MTSFFEQALVFIGSAVILVPLFQRWGFGSVLGYLVAGILVGPFGLRFVQEAESIMHFAEFGVVLLLFMIGLEIRPDKLWSMRRHLLGLGGLQVAACSMVLGLIAWQAGLEPVPAVIIGFALSLSSTAFALQTLIERNQFNTEFGRSSFSILLMQDLLAIPALALIPALAVSNASRAPSLSGSLFIILVIICLVVASRYLIRPAFRLIARTRSRDIFTAATLFLVLGVAALTQKIGLSAALGTFIAGVLLASSEYRHELETNLEPFKGLLMGLFFIAVGMGVDLNYVATYPFLVFASALGYLFIKMTLIYTVGRLFGLNHESSKLMGLTIAQGGEFAFVMFGMTSQFGLVSSEVITFLTVVVTLSMAFSPLALLVNDGWHRWIKAKGPEPRYDEIKDEAPEIIIAGYGRFGQMFARILRAQSIPFVAIEHDPDQIELARRFGSTVYYGDASRKDLLQAAGAEKAKYFILAIDDMEASLRAAEVALEHFPNMKIFARARNRGHVFELKDLGVKNIKRELFDSSVYFVQELLVDMGIAPARAENLIERFKRHDEIMLEEQYKVRSDDTMFISVSKQGSVQLAQVMNSDQMQSYIEVQPSPANN